jgi:hypothetical protein
MPFNIEVCLRHPQAVATIAAVALVLAANGSASADDSAPTAPRPVAPVDATPYGERPPPVWPYLDEREQAVPLMGPTYVAVETKYTMLAGGGGLLLAVKPGGRWSRTLRRGLPDTVSSRAQSHKKVEETRLCDWPTADIEVRTSCARDRRFT